MDYLRSHYNSSKLEDTYQYLLITVYNKNLYIDSSLFLLLGDPVYNQKPC